MKISQKKHSAPQQPVFSASLPLRRSALSLAILAILYPSISSASQDGAQVISGQVSIDTATPGVTTITNSPNAIIHWQNFSIAQNELVQFLQQNGQSAVLNRIIGQNVTLTSGTLTQRNDKSFNVTPPNAQVPSSNKIANLTNTKENILNATVTYPIMNVAAAVIVGTMHQQWQPFADEWNSNKDFMAEKGE